MRKALAIRWTGRALLATAPLLLMTLTSLTVLHLVATSVFSEELSIKKLVLEDCDAAIEASLELSDPEILELMPYLVRVVRLGLADVKQELLPQAPSGFGGDQPFRGVPGADFVKTYKREQESFARRCALKVLVTLRPHSLSVVPDLVDQFDTEMVSVIDPRFQDILSDSIQRIVGEARRLRIPVEPEFYQKLLELYEEKNSEIIQRIFRRLSYSSLDYLKELVFSSNLESREKAFALLRSFTVERTQIAGELIDRLEKLKPAETLEVLEFIESSLSLRGDDFEKVVALFLTGTDDQKELARSIIAKQEAEDDEIVQALSDDTARKLIDQFARPTKDRKALQGIVAEILSDRQVLQDHLVKLIAEQDDRELHIEGLSLLARAPRLSQRGRRLFEDSISATDVADEVKLKAIKLISEVPGPKQEFVDRLSSLLNASTISPEKPLPVILTATVAELAELLEEDRKLWLSPRLAGSLAALLPKWLREVKRSSRAKSLVPPANLLSRIGVKARSKVMPLLESSEPEVLAQATLILGHYYPASREEMQALVSLLGHDSSLVRSAAYQTLVDKGQASLPYLKRILDQEEDGSKKLKKELAAQALYSLDPTSKEVVPIFREKLRNEPCDKRIFSALTLLDLVPESAERYYNRIIECFRDPSFTQGAEALKEMVRRGPLTSARQEQLVDSILAVEGQQGLEIKKKLLSVGAHLGIPRFRLRVVVEELLKEPSARSGVLQELRNDGIKSFLFRSNLEQFASTLPEQSLELLEVLVTLAAIDPSYSGYATPLIELISSGDSQQKAKVFFDLLPPSSRAAFLMTLLETSREGLVLWALEELNRLGSYAEDSAPLLLSLLENTSPLVRYGALVTLLNTAPRIAEQYKVLTPGLFGQLGTYPLSQDGLTQAGVELLSRFVSDDNNPPLARRRAAEILLAAKSTIYRVTEP